jgi:lysyl-tRNA synthetase class 2
MKEYRQSVIKNNLVLRSKIIQSIRDFFNTQGYLEVETPIRISSPAPEAHIDAEPSGPWYLHTSPELCMKRLLASGYSCVYQICKCFRRKERGNRHLPEFTLLEWYTANDDYMGMMNQTEALIKHIAESISLAETITYRGKSIALQSPWMKLTVSEAFETYASMSLSTAVVQGKFDEIMALEVESKLPRNIPVFLHDYPSEMAALARLKPEDRSVAERFELYIGGLELCNAFTELTDPKEQRVRFKAEAHQRKRSDKVVYPMPERFLSALEEIPNATGNALGIDRLVMLFADAATIDEVVAFTPEEL